MDLKTASIPELKAAWLDQLVNVETAQNNIKIIRDELENRKLPPKPEEIKKK